MKKLMTLAFVAALAFGAVSCKKSSDCVCKTTSHDSTDSLAVVTTNAFYAAVKTAGVLSSDSVKALCKISNTGIHAGDSLGSCAIK